MKKSDFFSRILPVLMLFMTIAINAFGAKPAKQQYYEIKIYRISDKGQEGRVDAYLKEAYLPALHRAGIPVVGVFKPVEADTAFGKLVYVFIPYRLSVSLCNWQINLKGSGSYPKRKGVS